ncbi:uncharacterized protein FIBRA_09047 [Fibroporia radiculosa]|uniref:Uncharacterized protein n=1 Tax=Fibroporia radiculosa TaxID=599839 RepID=J4GXU5_9APHY|nr:uncharacterized protein FIBRA_09047 [Fibroporia radiculosa]CCM06750.1 predicted protein [Fibroporia radiculosa]
MAMARMQCSSDCGLNRIWIVVRQLYFGHANILKELVDRNSKSYSRHQIDVLSQRHLNPHVSYLETYNRPPKSLDSRDDDFNEAQSATGISAVG